MTNSRGRRIPKDNSVNPNDPVHSSRGVSIYDYQWLPYRLYHSSFLWDVNYGPPSVNSYTTGVDLTWSNYRTGVRRDDWRSRIKALNNATTYSEGFELSISPPFMDDYIGASLLAADGEHYQHYSQTGVPDEAYAQGFNPDVPGYIVADVRARALSQLLEDAQSGLSSFESGQDLGELKQTIESIIHPMKSLQKHVLSYFSSAKKLKSRYKSAVSMKKALADTYLEWHFGWEPLASDIADGIVGLSNTRLPTKNIRGYAKDNYASACDVTLHASNLGYTVTRVTKCEYQVRYKGVVNCYVAGKPPSVLQELRLLPRDFLPTAWDLLPYSFVADYFVNIGDIISAYSFPTAQIAWVNGTYRVVNNLKQHFAQDDTYNPYVGPAGWQWIRNFVCTNLELNEKLFTRFVPSLDDLIPPLSFHLPVSSRPWENIGALMASRTKSLVPMWR